MIPADELHPAAAVLSDLEWLAAEIEAGRADRARVERQRRAAGLLFSSLDDPAKVPALMALLTECRFDSNVVLKWYSGSIERVEHWERRLEHVTRAAGRLRPFVEQSLVHLDATARDQLTTDLAARRSSIERWTARPDPHR